MLWKEDLSSTYFFLRVYSKLGLLPIRIDGKTWKMSRETRSYKVVINAVHRILETLHLTCTTWRLFEAIFNFTPDMLGHFACAVLCQTMGLAIRIEDYNVLYDSLDVALSLNNKLMQHCQENQSRSQRSKVKKSLKSKLAGWTIREFYVVVAGVVVFSTILGHVGLFLLSPTAFNFIHSLVPQERQNGWTLMMGVVVEFYTIMGWASVGTFCIQQNLLLFLTCEQNMESSLEKIRKMNSKKLEMTSNNGAACRLWFSTFTLDSMYKTCQEVRVLTHFFNHVYRSSVFIYKLCYMFGSVFCIFTAIYLLESEPLIAFISFWNGLFMTATFILMYARTYKIPDGIAQMKKEMEVANVRMSSHNQVHEKRKQLLNSRRFKALPEIGIQVGSFKSMERTAAPEFVDFVVSQVVDLLLTFNV